MKLSLLDDRTIRWLDMNTNTPHSIQNLMPPRFMGSRLLLHTRTLALLESDHSSPLSLQSDSDSDSDSDWMATLLVPENYPPLDSATVGASHPLLVLRLSTGEGEPD